MAAKKSYGGPLALLALLGVGVYAQQKGLLRKIFTPDPGKTQGTANLDLRILGFDKHEGHTSANIEFVNPTSLSFRVQSITGRFSAAGRPAGTIKMFGDSVIRANDQAVLPVNVVMQNPALWKKGQQLIFSGQININNHLLNLQMRCVL